MFCVHIGGEETRPRIKAEDRTMQNEEFVKKVKRWIDGPREYTVNPQQYELFEITVKDLQDLFDKEGIKGNVITAHPELPLGDMFIFAETVHPIIQDTEKLAELISRMKNIELYSLPDVTVHFGARFAGVYKVKMAAE